MFWKIISQTNQRRIAMKRLITFLSLTLSLLLLASACGKTEPNADNSPDTTAAETTAETVENTAEETAENDKTDPTRPDWPDESKYTFFKVFEASKEAPRDAVLNYMRTMATVEWTPAKDWTTEHKDAAENSRLKLGLEYKAGKTYYGIPYANTASSLDGFLSVMEDGKFTPNSTYYTELIGNHCSSSMDRAFEQVVDIPGFGGILPEWCPEHLMYPEGSEIAAPEGWTNDTLLITEHCGKDKLFKGYAALDKGDILYRTSPAWGHTRMVSGVNISKSIAGKVMYEKSTVQVIEQTNAWYTAEKNST